MKPTRKALQYPCGKPPEAGTALEVAPGVLWLRMPLPLTLDHINLWAVRDGEGWAIFDTGMHTTQTEEAWRTLFAVGAPLGEHGPTRVFATHMHPDHIGMAGWLTRTYACELWMTRTEYLNCRVLVADTGRQAPPEGVRFYQRAGWTAEQIEHYRARFGGYGKKVSPLPESYQRLRDGQRLTIGAHQWQVVVGSGHSPEHACFYCPELNVLISGDQVLPRISSNVSVHPTEPAADPMGEWMYSLDKLKAELPADVLVLPAHGEPFRSLHDRLDHLKNGHLRALDRLRELLAEGPKRAVDVFSVLFAAGIDNELLPLATGESLANLNYLVQRGEVTASEDAHGAVWYQMQSAPISAD
ncbi:MBL fold metallo-hydrolase [Pseudomonas sp. LS44]|uniref:MBL fold metallo-hydrolase n=1 Tax=Pseudomonas sp. LS44 TaxID=1357074 RepID=UPI00215A8033|nr:MBL fold metallo-hydrolase [Pseudomonas sp. LS44]UVE16106.1 MBL fold metallo-hydrolase [Pseudomonas sp. LS44]